MGSERKRLKSSWPRRCTDIPTQCISAERTTTTSASSLRQPVVADDGRLDVVLRQLAQELERDVDDDLDVHPGVVVDLHPRDGVDVRDVPPRLELRVVVDAVEHAPQLAVAALGKPDAHAGDRLGGREPRLADGLGRDRAFDALLDLRVESSGCWSSLIRSSSHTRFVVESCRARARGVRERLAEAGAVGRVVEPRARARRMRQRDHDRVVGEVALADAFRQRLRRR